MVVLALCLVVIVAFSFVLGMISEASSGGRRAEVVASASCVAPAATGDGASEAPGGVEGGGESRDEGEGNIGDRAGERAHLAAEQQARRAAEGPIEFVADKLREPLIELRQFFPSDPNLNPALFLDKEIEEGKEKQDTQMQALLFSGKSGGEGAMNAADGEETAALPPVPTIGAAPKAERPVPAAAPSKPTAPDKVAMVQLPPAAPSPGASVYTIELGSFRSVGNAQSFAGTIKRHGYPVEIDAEKDAFGQSWFYIRLGRYPDSMQAAAALSDFESREGIGGTLVVLPPVPAK